MRRTFTFPVTIFTSAKYRRLHGNTSVDRSKTLLLPNFLEFLKETSALSVPRVRLFSNIKPCITSKVPKIIIYSLILVKISKSDSNTLFFTISHLKLIVFWAWELECDDACPIGNGYPSRRSATLAAKEKKSYRYRKAMDNKYSDRQHIRWRTY